MWVLRRIISPDGRLIADGDARDFWLVLWSNRAVIILHGRVFTQDVDDFHALGHATKRSIMTIKIVVVFLHDKELRARRIELIRAGHRNGAALVLQGINDAILDKFTFDSLGRATRAIALRVSTLHHKAIDDAVEGQAIVEARLREVAKIRNADGGFVGIQFELNLSLTSNLYCCVMRTLGIDIIGSWCVLPRLALGCVLRGAGA